MKNLILLMGKSGSGKNYLVEQWDLDPVISYTTRPMRQSETDGKEHYFILDEYYKSINPSTMLAYTYYSGNHYWADKKECENKEVYIIDPEGVRYFKDNLKGSRPIEYSIVYIKTSLFRRIYNMYKRGDSAHNIIKRIRGDRKDFSGVENLYDMKIVYNFNNPWKTFKSWVKTKTSKRKKKGFLE